MSVFEKLEEGQAVEDEASGEYGEDVVNRYKMAVLVLGAVSALSVLTIILMLLL
mgnify:CR=1 FL=1